jgi:hypothetical protein
MVSYAELASEPEWRAQFISPVMNAGLLGPLRVFYGLGPSAIGAAGDNNHLYGRHRSYNWDKFSRFCTNRNYGTTDARDQGGNRNWYRAFDVGIQGQQLFDASRRMDALARSGACPGLAEWFGTFNGVNVVGWFEGQSSSSDSSHLFHLHVGIWNDYANDAATIQQIYRTITGTGGGQVPAPGGDDMALYLVSAPNDPGVWLSNGVTRRSVHNQAEIEGWLGLGAIRYENVDLSWYGTRSDVPASSQVPVTVDAAAVAAALVANPTFTAALKQAAFEGAQKAEDQ